MLLAKTPIGTIGAMVGLPSTLTEFTKSLAMLVVYSYEYCCRPSRGEYIHLGWGESSDFAISRNSLARTMMGEWLLMTDADDAFDKELRVV